VLKAVRARLNNDINSCAIRSTKDTAPVSEQVAKVHIPKGGLRMGVAAGTVIFVHGLRATTKSGKVMKFNVQLGRRLSSHPTTGPAMSVDHQGAHDPLRKFQIESLEPSPCEAEAWTEAQFAQLEEETAEDFLQSGGGFIAPKPEEIYVDESLITEDEMDAIPEEFDWAKSKPGAWSETMSQGSCGCCWAWAATTAMSARIFIQSAGKVNVRISPQWATSCAKDTGCNGGNAQMAFGPEGMSKENKESRAVDLSCYPFYARAAQSSNPDQGGAQCMKTYNPATDFVAGTGVKAGAGTEVDSACMHYNSKQYDRRDPGPFGGGSHYTKSVLGTQWKDQSEEEGVAKIQREIMKYGPAFMSFDVMGDFGNGRTGDGWVDGIYRKTSDEKRGGHAVTLVGWGQSNGVPYWKLQNSWGKSWGQDGFFKVRRGSNEADLEKNGISCGQPDLDTLCSNACVNGAMKQGCKCQCREGFGGEACDKCVLPCTGDNYTGKKVMSKFGAHPKEKCQCECKAGFFGKKCSLSAKGPTGPVQSGSEFQFDLHQAVGSNQILNGDELVAYPQDVTPWSAKGGWKEPAAKPTKFGEQVKEKFGTAAFVGDKQLTMTLYNPGTYQLYLVKWMGVSEFGDDKGRSTTLVSMGAVTVAKCGDACKPAPPTCFNKKGFEQYCGSDNILQHCYAAKRVSFNFNGQTVGGKVVNQITLAEMCPKACHLCGGGPPPVPPPPPPPPAGTGVVTSSCVAKHSLGKCQQCLTSDQCGPQTPGGKNRFCCPYLKKCVIDGHEACGYPIANCRPVCRGDGIAKKCAGCKDTRFPMEWQKQVCKDGEAPKPDGDGGKKGDETKDQADRKQKDREDADENDDKNDDDESEEEERRKKEHDRRVKEGERRKKEAADRDEETKIRKNKEEERRKNEEDRRKNEEDRRKNEEDRRKNEEDSVQEQRKQMIREKKERNAKNVAKWKQRRADSAKKRVERQGKLQKARAARMEKIKALREKRVKARSRKGGNGQRNRNRQTRRKKESKCTACKDYDPRICKRLPARYCNGNFGFRGCLVKEYCAVKCGKIAKSCAAGGAPAPAQKQCQCKRDRNRRFCKKFNKSSSQCNNGRFAAFCGKACCKC